jgi:hypothetical protein
MVTVDTESPPRAWLDAWLSGARTKEELRVIIQEQQDRLDAYVKRIEALEHERAGIMRWRVEATHQDMMQRGIIERYRSALEDIAKSNAPGASAIAESALRVS